MGLVDWVKGGVKKGIDFVGKKFSGGGGGLTVSSIPFEAHVPGYQFCGPGTKYTERVARGEKGINQLDSACMKHDGAYNANMEKTDANRKRRREADDELIGEANKFRKRPDASFRDKASGLVTEGAMRAKVGLGIF